MNCPKSVLDTVVDGSSPFFGLCRRYSEIADFKEKDFRGSAAKDVVFADLEWEREGGGRSLLGMEGSMEQFRGAIQQTF